MLFSAVPSTFAAVIPPTPGDVHIVNVHAVLCQLPPVMLFSECILICCCCPRNYGCCVLMIGSTVLTHANYLKYLAWEG